MAVLGATQTAIFDLSTFPQCTIFALTWECEIFCIIPHISQIRSELGKLDGTK